MVLTDEARKRAPWKAYVKPAIIRQYSLEDCKIKKVVCPGARVGRLLDEVSLLHVQGYTFDEIIVHCGTNYAGADYNDNKVAVEIQDLFGALNQISPLSTLTFSEILPHADPGLMAASLRPSMLGINSKRNLRKQLSHQMS